MRIYVIVLFIFAFCLVQNMITTMELFEVDMPSNEADGLASAGEKMVSDMENISGDVSSEVGLNFGLVGFAWKLAGVILGAFKDLILIGPMLKSMGVPGAFADVVQAITWFILAFGMFQLWTNRSAKGFE